MPAGKYITVKHGRVTLLCKPVVGAKYAYRAVGTFTDEGELRSLIEQLEREK